MDALNRIFIMTGGHDPRYRGVSRNVGAPGTIPVSGCVYK
jgi:hypothetical protein